jgi:hypothetical protein
MADTSSPTPGPPPLPTRGRPRPGLSVCCLTSDPPSQVAVLLSIVRDVADEIVVAVDQRVDPALLPPLLDVADRVVRFEFVDPPERTRPWLVGLCQQPWVLMLDGDEVPSTELIAALPELIADEGAVQCALARRWCFPDEAHWLAERPWWPDFQRRLFRRGPLLDFELQVHGGVRAVQPARLVVESIYHLACVQSPFAERRARARRYEALRPGLVAVGGGPMNETLYVPEHFATLRPADTPPDDLKHLQLVLQAATEPVTGSGPAPWVPVVSAEEIAAAAPPDPFAGHGYRASLRVVEIDRRSEPGNDTLMVVEVRNEGDEPIPHEDRAGVQIRVGARVLEAGTDVVVREGSRSPLPCDVPVGESRLVEALVPVPDAAGRYDVEFDLINERHRWFGCPVRVPVDIATRWGRFRLPRRPGD